LSDTLENVICFHALKVPGCTTSIELFLQRVRTLRAV